MILVLNVWLKISNAIALKCGGTNTIKRFTFVFGNALRISIAFSVYMLQNLCKLTRKRNTHLVSNEIMSFWRQNQSLRYYTYSEYLPTFGESIQRSPKWECCGANCLRMNKEA